MRARKWVWLGLVLGAASCVQILDGDHPYGTDPKEGPKRACETELNCNDDNPCTVDTCTEDTKVCEWLLAIDGVAPSGQTMGDCRSIWCEGGAKFEMADAEDVPVDDNDCTNDVCTDGVPGHENVADGAECTLGGKLGTCEAGACSIACDETTGCDDGNPCTDDSCNLAENKCVFAKLDGLPTPGVTPVDGDCRISLCVDGSDTAVVDEADVVVDGNSCSYDLCNLGMPVNPPVEAGTLCVSGGSNVCDGAGKCVECVVAENCVNIAEDECTKRGCVNNKCVEVYNNVDTLASPALQTPGDCKKIVCNGGGGVVSVSDNADLPVDNNPCTKDVCTSGVPSNPLEPQNTVCGNGLVCNTMGTCVGCNTADQCAGTDTECRQRVCMAGSCSVQFTAAGTDVMTGQTAGDCKVRECDGMGNVVTSVDTSDRPVDGNQCTQDVCSAMGVPSNPFTAAGSVCSVGNNDVCDGAGTCKKSDGKTCAANNECLSGSCVDGVCCNNSCSNLCRSCNVAGSVGTCTNVPKGVDDAPACTGANSCDGTGVCKKDNGQVCASATECVSGFCADGVCCNAACSATCKSCNMTGTVGTCSFIPAGGQDNSTQGNCSGTNACDGTGQCLKNIGSVCAINSDCASGFCVDGYCCDRDCSGLCQACSNLLSGSNNGVCAFIKLGNDPQNECPNGSCAGDGTCVP